MNISPARAAAFEILVRIERERSFSSVLLARYDDQLSPKDRALCHKLTLGVLRRQIELDRTIDSFTEGKRLDLEVRISLRLGLFQLWFLDKIPVHSAVNESVELVRRAKKSSARGMVNAILRRVPKKPPELRVEDPIERISIETSHPRWLIEHWAEQFGTEAASRLAAANNLEPLTTFRYTARSTDAPKFSGVRPSTRVAGSFVIDEMNASIIEAAARGEIYFQDEGSQLVANAVEIPEGGLFLDVCAAPGSKVTQIGARQKQGLLVAGDVHSHRARFLDKNIKGQNVRNAVVVQYDAERELPFAEHKFDTVLVDAPCSGTGTIRHNPELRYAVQPEDFVTLSAKQLRILTNASKLVKAGGTLVYSTCSLEFVENEQVAEAFLSGSSAFRKVRPNVPQEFVTDTGYARTRPDVDDMDGFFIAAFESTTVE